MVVSERRAYRLLVDGMSERPTGSPGSPHASAPDVAGSSWVEDPGYPHRIENHVKVYLHLEPAPTSPPLAEPHTAPPSTRVRHYAAGRWQRGTVTGWTTQGEGVFLSYDEGGTYAGPTFGSVIVEVGDDDRASRQSRWAVSGATVDGYPLDGVEDGHYCDYEGHPLGARPDWDLQHRQAAEVSLPTADELLPLLATALGTRIQDPAVDQLREAIDLIHEHQQWRAARADLSAGESAGHLPSAAAWHESDDVGCDLAERAVALLARISGQAPGLKEALAGATGEPMMRAALEATSTGPVRSEPPSPSTPTATPPSR